jgi:ATP-binding cassette, subfamily G (WHITE), member 2
VEETLLYTAQLRLPPTITKEQQHALVKDILAQMGLDHVRKTCIGSPLHRGVSGGERKRVCVAMELLTQASPLAHMHVLLVSAT